MHVKNAHCYLDTDLSDGMKGNSVNSELKLSDINLHAPMVI
jgi:hypothetical protein